MLANDLLVIFVRGGRSVSFARYIQNALILNTSEPIIILLHRSSWGILWAIVIVRPTLQSIRRRRNKNKCTTMSNYVFRENAHTPFLLFNRWINNETKKYRCILWMKFDRIIIWLDTESLSCVNLYSLLVLKWWLMNLRAMSARRCQLL